VRTFLIRTSDHTVYAEMLDITSPNIAAFCQRHDLQYRVFKGLKRGHWDWHSCFNRLYMFEELIAEGHDGWVIYLDADAFVVDLDFPIGKYLDSKSDHAGVLVHSGATPAYWDVNNGVMFLNLGNPVAKLIVRDWIDRHEKIFNETEYLSRDRPSYFGDQRLLQHTLRDNPQWFDALHIETQDLMNSMHASFIRHHIRGLTPDFDRRLAMVRQDVDDVMTRYSAETAPNGRRRPDIASQLRRLPAHGILSHV
jgi:hypothetical protein